MQRLKWTPVADATAEATAGGALVASGIKPDVAARLAPVAAAIDAIDRSTPVRPDWPGISVAPVGDSTPAPIRHGLMVLELNGERPNRFGNDATPWTKLTIYSTDYIEGNNPSDEDGGEDQSPYALLSYLLDNAPGLLVGCTFDGSMFQCEEGMVIGTEPTNAWPVTPVGIDWTGFADKWEQYLERGF